MAKREEQEEGYVQIQSGDVTLDGNLIIPEGAPGLVLFAHGSGSSRFSSRNRTVAKTLRKNAGMGTLLFEEPGALDEVARMACDWFKQHLNKIG
jgi:fermentation-respiration switch protein FrsA (DUF1100 family)